MATIIKRKSKSGIRYRAQIQHVGKPSLSKTFGTKREAREWIVKTERQIEQEESAKSLFPDLKTVPDVEYLVNKSILEQLKTKKIQEKRKDQMRHLKFWVAHLGSIKLHELTPKHIINIRNKLIEGRSNATFNRYLAAFSVVLSYAVKECHYIKANPMKQVSKLKEPRGRVRYLSDDERHRLLLECKKSKNKYLYPGVIIALSTGMRRGEIFNLHWEDIDFHKKRAILTKTKNNERRSISLLGPAWEALLSLLPPKGQSPLGKIFPENFLRMSQI